ncbi:hypothetical protein ACLOJK_016672 [Asimina triloba]
MEKATFSDKYKKEDPQGDTYERSTPQHKQLKCGLFPPIIQRLECYTPLKVPHEKILMNPVEGEIIESGANSTKIMGILLTGASLWKMR